MFEKLHIKGDRVMWTIVLLLFSVGLMTVYSATGTLAWKHYKSDSTQFLVKQIMFMFLGLVLIYIIHRMNYMIFYKLSSFMMLVSIPLLIYTLAMGTSLNEGARWVTIPGLGQTIQSSDLAKIALFTYLAKLLSAKQKDIKSFKKGFQPLLWPVLLIVGSIAPANLSTALVLALTSGVIFFIGRVPLKFILGLGFTVLIILGIVFQISKMTGWGRATTWESRIESFMNKDENKYEQEKNFQITQAAIAVAGGGVLGRGPGNSWAKDYLPHSYSDFIYAIIIEEYGLVGGTITMLLYLMLFWRSILIFRKTPYAFGAFLALAISFALVFQAFVNMAVTVQLFPVTGLTLPLISMGGSSILATSMSIGIILSVSNYSDRLEEKKKEKEREDKLAKQAEEEEKDDQEEVKAIVEGIKIQSV